MARNVGDVGLMFDAQIGYDPRDPISLPSEGVSYRATAERPLRPEQFAFSPDLGVCAVAREVRDICRTAADKAASDGVTMSEAPPPLAGVYEVFHTLRAHLIAGLYETLIREHRDEIKPDIVWNVEKGAAQAVSEVSAAERERAALIAGFDGFLEREKFLLTPAAQVLPFPVEQKFPTEIDGKPLETYVDWITITFALSTVAVPVAVVPCGYSKSGLPVAMQSSRQGAASTICSASRRISSSSGVARRTCRWIPKRPRRHLLQTVETFRRDRPARRGARGAVCRR